MKAKHTFSNGHTVSYSGKRAVECAWMVETPSGEIYSGMSVNALAASSAASNACQLFSVPRHDKSESAEKARKQNAEHSASCKVTISPIAA